MDTRSLSRTIRSWKWLRKAELVKRSNGLIVRDVVEIWRHSLQPKWPSWDETKNIWEKSFESFHKLVKRSPRFGAVLALASKQGLVTCNLGSRQRGEGKIWHYVVFSWDVCKLVWRAWLSDTGLLFLPHQGWPPGSIKGLITGCQIPNNPFPTETVLGRETFVTKLPTFDFISWTLTWIWLRSFMWSATIAFVSSWSSVVGSVKVHAMLIWKASETSFISSQRVFNIFLEVLFLLRSLAGLGSVVYRAGWPYSWTTWLLRWSSLLSSSNSGFLSRRTRNQRVFSKFATQSRPSKLILNLHD